jgi:tetratricopeptide (TPR) repeat protein
MKRIACLLFLAHFCLAGFRYPPGALRYQELGQKSAADGDYPLALDYYNQAIQLDPGIAELYMTRGFFLLKLNRTTEALGDFSSFIRLEPDNSEGYLSRGMIYSQLDRKEEARRDFTTACRLGNQGGCSFAEEERK